MIVFFLSNIALVLQAINLRAETVIETDASTAECVWVTRDLLLDELGKTVFDDVVTKNGELADVGVIN